MDLVDVADVRAGVRQVTLNAPKTANALSSQLVGELAQAISDAHAASARLLILRSSGRIFCGGFDLKEEVASDGDAIRRFSQIQGLLEALDAFPGATLALVEGDAMGAGADIVARCDFRVLASGARVAFPGAAFGLVLGLARLVSITSGDTARDVVLRGRAMKADEAHAVGFATDLLEPEEWTAYVDSLADRIVGLDAETVRAILAITRARPDNADASALVRSVNRPGIATRLAEYRASRLKPKRSG